MKYLLLLLLIVLILGCNMTEFNCFRVPDSKKDKMISFVSTCIKNANHILDDEPEDMILECYDTGIKLFGIRYQGNISKTKDFYGKICNEGDYR